MKLLARRSRKVAAVSSKTHPSSGLSNTRRLAMGYARVPRRMMRSSCSKMRTSKNCHIQLAVKSAPIVPVKTKKMFSLRLRLSTMKTDKRALAARKWTDTTKVWPH